MIVTVTPNPSIDRTVFVDTIRLREVNRVLATETDAGGKGVNLARVAKELGADVVATGFLAGSPGQFVRNVLDREGVRHQFVEIPGETRVNIFVEQRLGSGPPTSFNEDGAEVSSESWQTLLGKVRELAAGAGWATLGGSVPPGLNEESYVEVLETMRAAGCKVVIDADSTVLRRSVKFRPDLVKPNASEAQSLLGERMSTLREALKGAQMLHDSGIGIAIVSRGAAGAALACSEGLFHGFPPRVEANSTIGSGDSMIGAMLWALEAGKSTVEAFAWGIAAGAATATTSGSEIARKPMVDELIRQVRVEKHAAP